MNWKNIKKKIGIWFDCKMGVHDLVLIKGKEGSSSDVMCCKNCKHTLYCFITGFEKIERNHYVDELLKEKLKSK